MTRFVALRRATVAIALTAFAPVALGEDVVRQVVDAPRAAKAPVDLPPGADVVEVSSGLVWLRLQNGRTAYAATKVGEGVYFTREAYELANKAFKARGEARDAARLRAAELEATSCPAPSESIPTPLSCPADAYPPPAFVTGRWPTWAVVGVGVLSFAAGASLVYAVTRPSAPSTPPSPGRPGKGPK